MAQPTFEDFYNGFGFATYPFQMFSSEDEKQVQPEIFIRTAMYGPIIAGFINKQSMIMAGDRGSGKTAIIYDFIRETSTPEKSLIIQVDDYSSLPGVMTTDKFYQFLMEKICIELFTRIAINKVKVKNLSRENRVALCYYLYHFVPQYTKVELKKQIETIQISKGMKLAIFIYRFLRIPGNVGLNITCQFLSQVLAAALSTSAGNAETKFSDFLPDLKLEADENFLKKDNSFHSLERLSDLINGLGLGLPICILDKVDEDARFVNAAEEIAEFIKPILTDTKLLTSDKIQLVVSVWIIPYNLMKSDVRTQKVYCPVIDWARADLEKAANKRIGFFSGCKSEFKKMFSASVNETDISYIFSLSNRNPRDLWHLMNHIMLAQYSEAPDATVISLSALKKGFDDFVTTFNFFEYYPKKSGAKSNSMDVYSYVKHLLKLTDVVFTRDRLNVVAGTGSSTQNYCVGMENLGLIEKAEKTGAQLNYRIRDPKVIHALRNGLDISRSS